MALSRMLHLARLFADDTTVYASDVSPIVLQFVINNDLNLLSTWFNQNRPLINNDKTQALPVRKCKYDYRLVLNGTSVEPLNIIKILGVTLDSMLIFKEHITIQLKKAYAKISALRRIRRFVPINVMLKLYKAFILPHLEYCSPLLLGVGKVLNSRMEDPNYYVLRSILGQAKSVPCEQLLRIASINTLKHMLKVGNSDFLQ